MKLKTRSPKYLAKFFNLDPKKAAELHKIANSNRNQLEEILKDPQYESTLKWFNSLYRAPKTYELRLELLNTCLGYYGAESIKINDDSLGIHASDYITYLNSGDTYNNTIIYYAGVYYLSTLGDFVEKKNL